MATYHDFEKASINDSKYVKEEIPGTVFRGNGTKGTQFVYSKKATSLSDNILVHRARIRLEEKEKGVSDSLFVRNFWIPHITYINKCIKFFFLKQ